MPKTPPGGFNLFMIHGGKIVPIAQEPRTRQPQGCIDITQAILKKKATLHAGDIIVSDSGTERIFLAKETTSLVDFARRSTTETTFRYELLSDLKIIQALQGGIAKAYRLDQSASRDIITKNREVLPEMIEAVLINPAISLCGLDYDTQAFCTVDQAGNVLSLTRNMPEPVQNQFSFNVAIHTSQTEKIILSFPRNNFYDTNTFRCPVEALITLIATIIDFGANTLPPTSLPPHQ